MLPFLLRIYTTHAPFDTMSTRLDMQLYSIHIPEHAMGQKQNRKRTRHRPSRTKRQRASLESATELRHVRTASLQSKYGPDASLPYYQPQPMRQESAMSRDRRLFGGEDDDTASAMELRGPMLDVVLGLFNAIDYDDALV